MSDVSLLILDDEPDDIQQLKSFAESLGILVELATSVSQGLDLCNARHKNGSSFSLMIVDLRIGKEDREWKGGWDFLRNAPKWGQTTVIVYTHHGDRSKVELPYDVHEKYFCKYFSKKDPSGKKEIRDILNSHARQGKHGRTYVADSPSDKALLAELPHIARSGFDVLITGDTGSGKELIAKELAQLAGGILCVMNCANLTEQLAMSQLFGHHKGAFTGAYQDKAGIILRASGYLDKDLKGTKRAPSPTKGNVFFDELAELSLQVQANLLRALDHYDVTPLGGEDRPPFKTNFRAIACTNDIATLTERHSFRQDLIGRLQVCHLHIPPIHTRPESALGIVRKYGESFRMAQPSRPESVSVSEEALKVVEKHLSDQCIVDYGARALIAWTQRACAIALDNGATTGPA